MKEGEYVSHLRLLNSGDPGLRTLPTATVQGADRNYVRSALPAAITIIYRLQRLRESAGGRTTANRKKRSETVPVVRSGHVQGGQKDHVRLPSAWSLPVGSIP